MSTSSDLLKLYGTRFSIAWETNREATVFELDTDDEQILISFLTTMIYSNERSNNNG